LLYLEELLNTYSDGASCLVECLVANKTGMILDGTLLGNYELMRKVMMIMMMIMMMMMMKNLEWRSPIQV